MAGAHRQDLVRTVRIEGGEGGLGRLIPVQVEPGLLTAVTDHEIPAREVARQDHDQGGEHPGRLFGIAVREKEAAPLIDQQLVKLGLHAAR